MATKIGDSPALTLEVPGMTDFSGNFPSSVDEVPLRAEHPQQAKPDNIEHIDGRNSNEPEFAGDEPHLNEDDGLPVVGEAYYDDGEDQEEDEPAEAFVYMCVITEFLNRERKTPKCSEISQFASSGTIVESEHGMSLAL